MPYILFENIRKSYGNQPIFDGFSLSIEKGSFVTLLGPSGCGKSTLLRCLAGLEPLDSGRIFLDDDDITAKHPKDRSVGMIFQQYSLFPTMTVFNNISFGLRMKKAPPNAIKERVNNALRMVNLEGSEKKYPSQLSGGEQQRVALARCLVTQPKVLLLDEPFSAIDAKLRKTLQQRIREIHEELGMTTIFVTHDQDEAMTLSDTIHLMNTYVIEQSGSPLDLYARPKTKFAASFMGNNNILSREDFKNFTGTHSPAETVVIRPELISLRSEVPKQTGEGYSIQAVVKDRIPQGNVIRYHAAANQVILTVDVLFDHPAFFEPGDTAWLSFSKEDLYLLSD